jgi:hypothetical protein
MKSNAAYTLSESSLKKVCILFIIIFVDPDDSVVALVYARDQMRNFMMGLP